MEIFKDIKGYPDYQVSNCGRVWNVKTQRMLKPSVKANGYLQINMIAANGLRKKEYVHRLVALTFLENPNNLPQCDHIDRNRSNNNVENLRWVDASTNQRNRDNKISQYDKEGNLIKTYNSITEAIEAVGGTSGGLYSYFQGRAKYYKGFTWIRH